MSFRFGVPGLHSETIYLGRWQTILAGAVLVAFGFGGVWAFLEPFRSPLSPYTGVLVGAVVGFILHEMAHEYAARSQGCLAGFVLTRTGAAITAFFGIIRSLAPGFPFFFIAPGYVSILCTGFNTLGRRRDTIAAAGPMANIVLAFLAALAAQAPGAPYGLLAGFKSINAWMAIFNLLPLEPLDGARIFREQPMTWLILILAAGIALIA